MSQNFSGDEVGTLRPEDLVEEAEREAASQAIDMVVEKHIDQIMAIREQYPLNDRDLFSTNITKFSDIPQSVRQDVGSLRQKLRGIIEKVAARIEDRKYKSSEEAINDMKLAYNEREQVSALIKSDKKVHVSYQSLRIAVESFSEFNKLIIKRLEESEKAGDAQMQRNLIFGNALLVYELTDFVINYIESFRVQGIEEIDALHATMAKRFEQFRAEQEQLKQQVQTDDVDEAVREQILLDIKNREDSIAVVVKEWDDYVKTIRELVSETGGVKKRLPTLKAIRDNAKSQISLLEAVAVMQIVQSNIGALNATIATLEKIELVSLSPDRVRSLLGIKNKLLEN